MVYVLALAEALCSAGATILIRRGRREADAYTVALGLGTVSDVHVPQRRGKAHLAYRGGGDSHCMRYLSTHPLVTPQR